MKRRRLTRAARCALTRRLGPLRRLVAIGHGYIAIMAEYPTLSEWAGGRGAFDRMINAFYDRVERG